MMVAARSRQALSSCLSWASSSPMSSTATSQASPFSHHRQRVCAFLAVWPIFPVAKGRAMIRLDPRVEPVRASRPSDPRRALQFRPVRLPRPTQQCIRRPRLGRRWRTSLGFPTPRARPSAPLPPDQVSSEYVGTRVTPQLLRVALQWGCHRQFCLSLAPTLQQRWAGLSTVFWRPAVIGGGLAPRKQLLCCDGCIARRTRP